MVCNVVTYRARSALRDVAKALAFPPDVIDRAAKALDTRSAVQAADSLPAVPRPRGGDRAAPAGRRCSLPWHLLSDLLRQMDGVPRHLSIHVGGMIITAAPLVEVVPLERATMPGRVVVQWDKDSVEDAGLIKIDLLSPAHPGRGRGGAGATSGRSGGSSLDLDRPAAGRPGGLRPAAAGRHGRLLPGGEPRPGADAAQAPARAALRTLSSAWPSSARPDPGRHGPSLPAPPPGVGAGALCPSLAGAGRWPRRWA